MKNNLWTCKKCNVVTYNPNKYPDFVLDVCNHIWSVLYDGEPCSHKGCLNHMSHPCEGCGRIGGKLVDDIDINQPEQIIFSNNHQIYHLNLLYLQL